MPEISVIVPVYNVEKYVEQCIKSIVNQTFKNFELIIVDDGSTDNSGKLCDNFAENDYRIHVIHTENRGVAAARNKGLDIAIGEFICFVDSDDYVQNNYLAYMYGQIRNSDYDFVSCTANFVNENSFLLQRNSYDTKKMIIDSNIIKTYMTTNYIEDVAWNKLYKRDVWENLRYLENVNYEDTEIIIRLLKRCRKILFTNEYLYNYRIRAGSILNYNGYDINKKKYSEKNLDLFMVYESRAAQLRETEWETECYRMILILAGDYLLHIRDFPKSEQNIVASECRKWYRKYKKYLRNSKLFSNKERIFVLLEIYIPELIAKG